MNEALAIYATTLKSTLNLGLIALLAPMFQEVAILAPN